MAYVSMKTSTVGVNMFTEEDWIFFRDDPYQGQSATSFSWLTENGHDMQVNGLGFGLDPVNPATGLIQELELDFGNNGFSTPDVTITGLSVGLPAVTGANASDFFDVVFADGDFFHGSEHKDYLRGMAGDDSLYGGGGDDILYGGEGDDTLRGGEGINTLSGGDGDDVLEEGGTDLMLGGSGDDIIVLKNATVDLDRWYGGAGIDTFDASQGHNNRWRIDLARSLVEDDLDGDYEILVGFENVIGSRGADKIHGDLFDNVLAGGEGRDNIYGAGGDDTLIGGADQDFLYGGEGDDVFHVFADQTSESDRDSYDGDGGYDTIILFGADGAQSYDMAGLSGGPRDIEEIRFGANLNSDKTLKLQSADLGFGAKAETVEMLIKGVDAANAKEAIEIRMDYDTFLDLTGLTFEAWGAQGEKIFVKGSQYQDIIDGSNRADEIRGGDGFDQIDGGGGKDLLRGGRLGDELSGGGGADKVYGDKGDDIINGGRGKDVIVGGQDDDLFVFRRGDGVDTIKDFTAGEDKIYISSDDVSSFEDMTIRDKGDYAVAVYGSGDKIKLIGVEAASLIESDFQFATA